MAGAVLLAAGALLPVRTVDAAHASVSPSPHSTSPSHQSGSPSAQAKTVTATLTDNSMQLSTTTFMAGEYSFAVKNTGKSSHALAVSGPGISGTKQTKTLSPGSTADLKVTLKSGTYKLWSPTDNDQAQGLKKEITVSG
ncbi:hypothetical protein [Actinomadura verrucosospora]|uniref:Putative copper-binding protein n=1 Tax=Actinomadura verrucosospora TaxID=46165 RepID=A0A7D3W190_ACTVE|nr:hypothetical protein [Actinomadura verrucosospora]QKG27079.1 putative copper-binding protein [Actinomadura verrucosospora]